MAYHIGYLNPDTGTMNPAIEQGSTFSLSFTVTDVFAGNSANDLSIRAQYRPNIASANASNFTCTIVNRVPAAGNTAAYVACTVEMPANETANLAAGVGCWDCEIQDSANFVLKPLGINNKAKVLAEVTRA